MKVKPTLYCSDFKVHKAGWFYMKLVWFIWNWFDWCDFKQYKVGLILSLFFRTFSIVSDFSRFHSEVCHLKKIFKKLCISCQIYRYCINKLLSERLSQNPFGKIRVICKSSTYIFIFFQFNDKMPYYFRSNVVYKFSYSRCNATYYSETYQHLSVRNGEHLHVSPLPLKALKCDNHLLIFSSQGQIKSFDITYHLMNSYWTKMKRHLPICFLPMHFPLYLFDWPLPCEIIFQWYLKSYFHDIYCPYCYCINPYTTDYVRICFSAAV